MPIEKCFFDLILNLGYKLYEKVFKIYTANRYSAAK